MKTAYRVSALAVSVITVMAVASAPARAALDNELSTVDGADRTLTIEQWDTVLNGVPPLDRNRLTREWFQSGRAIYVVSGPGADQFAGSVELGYQVSFPWSLGVGIDFSYTTPNVRIDKGSLTRSPLGLGRVITPNLFPGGSIKADLGNGPGVQEVSTSKVNVSGASGTVAVSDAHGTITGAAGGVLLRPFARLISNTGDAVTTYGEISNMG